MFKICFAIIKIQLFREMNYKHQVIQSIILLALQKNNDTVSKNLHVHFLYVKPQKSLKYFIICTYFATFFEKQCAFPLFFQPVSGVGGRLFSKFSSKFKKKKKDSKRKKKYPQFSAYFYSAYLNQSQCTYIIFYRQFQITGEIFLKQVFPLTLAIYSPTIPPKDIQSDSWQRVQNIPLLIKEKLPPTHDCN